MNKHNLESLLFSALKSATRGLPPARGKGSAASPLSGEQLSAVSGGARQSPFNLVRDRVQVVSGGSDRGSSLFEGFDFDGEGPGFVEFTTPEFVEASPPQFIEFTEPEFVEASPPQFIEFTEPEFVEASPPQFIEFTEPEFVEATPPGGFPGFGGGLR